MSPSERTSASRAGRARSGGVRAHPGDQARALDALLLGALCLSIPAFYLFLDLRAQWQRSGQLLYVLVAALVALAVLLECARTGWSRKKLSGIDTLIAIGALASAWTLPWPAVQWTLRLVFCGIVFLRIAMLMARHVAPNRLVQIVVLAMLLLALAGEGFVLLEPKVHSYADGLWLAFVTAATLGYGDMVPSNVASRIFAGFIVFLGYAFFSVVTASISALLVGEDERRIRKELHADMRLLRNEIAGLREELRASRRAG